MITLSLCKMTDNFRRIKVGIPVYLMSRSRHHVAYVNRYVKQGTGRRVIVDCRAASQVAKENVGLA